MKWMSIILVFLMVACSNHDEQKQKDSLIKQSQNSKEETIQDNISNINNELDGRLEQYISEQEGIVGVDIQHHGNVMIVVIVFNKNETKETINELKTNYLSAMYEMYGDEVVHLQGIQNGEQVINEVVNLSEFIKN